MPTFVTAECPRHGVGDFYIFKRGARASHRPKCKKCQIESVTDRRKKVRQILLEEAGGCCSQCGYNRCSDALEFHHLDPKQKDLQISSGNTLGIDRLREEIEKCVLVCSCCHREIHAGLRVVR